MTYYEFEEVLHTSWEDLAIKYSIDGEVVGVLKEAVTHFTNLKKLDSVFRKKHGVIPKIEVKKFGTYFEYWYVEGKKPKRVCGYPLKGKQKGVVCLRRAGYLTAHSGYGYCMDHERLLEPSERRGIWLQLRRVHRNVPTMVELLERAEEVEEIAIKTMSADLSYLEIARQAIMRRAENNSGVMTRDMSMDLAMISETVAKVKALKVKTESINWIPPEKVGPIILQVLDAISKNEDEDVRRRLAERAKDLSSILVPVIDENPEIPQYKRDGQIKRALGSAEKYVDTGWSEMPETTGYDPHKPKVEKPEPNYRRNHRILKARKDAAGADSKKAEG